MCILNLVNILLSYFAFLNVIAALKVSYNVPITVKVLVAIGNSKVGYCTRQTLSTEN